MVRKYDEKVQLFFLWQMKWKMMLMTAELSGLGFCCLKTHPWIGVFNVSKHRGLSIPQDKFSYFSIGNS